MIVIRVPGMTTEEEVGRVAEALPGTGGAFLVDESSDTLDVVLHGGADGLPNVDRLIEQLREAGISAVEADEAKCQRLKQLLQDYFVANAEGPTQGCGIPSSSGAGAAPAESVTMTSLADSLDPLREAFNAAKGTARFIALLSPT